MIDLIIEESVLCFFECVEFDEYFYFIELFVSDGGFDLL